MLKGQAKGPEPPQQFERLVRPHVASFDYFLQDGMRQAVQLLEPLEVGVQVVDGMGSFWLLCISLAGCSSTGPCCSSADSLRPERSALLS
jgi:hypothetical protein